MKEYQVVFSESMERLNEALPNYYKNGWKPLGDVVHDYRPQTGGDQMIDYYHQNIFRELNGRGVPVV